MIHEVWLKDEPGVRSNEPEKIIGGSISQFQSILLYANYKIAKREILAR
jgi:hypothetical protein